MSAVSFGTRDKGQDVTTMLAKFEPLNSEQRDDVIEGMPEPKPEELSARETLLRLSAIHGLGLAYAVNVSALNTTWVNGLGAFLPNSGVLYVFPEAHKTETDVMCVQLKYDSNQTSAGKNVPGMRNIVYTTLIYEGSPIVEIICHNFKSRSPRRWTIRFFLDPDVDRPPYDIGVLTGMLRVGFPEVDKY